MAVAGLMMAHQVAGKAARDGIFLSQFSSTALPKIVAAAAVVAVIGSLFRGRTLVRVGPLRVTVLSFAVSGILQAGEWLLLQFQPRVAACVIYLHVVGFGAIVLSGFWSVLNEHFDPRVAKRVFGRIGGMGTLGGLAGGLMAERVAAWMSTSELVLALAILHLACAYVLWSGFRRASPAEAHPPPPENSTIREAGRRYPFLLTLAGLVLATSTSAALLDFVFKAQAADIVGKAEALVRFFGVFYTATSLLTFLVQTFVVRFALHYVGLAGSASALPATAAAGGLTGLLIPGFGVFNSVRAIEVVVRGSLFLSAYELFYTAVAPSDKRAAKSFIDVGMDRMGDALGAGLVQLFLVLVPGRHTGILMSACACSVVAFVLTVRLRKGYLLALENSLVNRGVELDPSLVEDSTTYSVLMQTLALRGSTGSSRE
jgi:ATP/ADP translocase